MSDKRICDRCDCFDVHPSGCSETCPAQRQTAYGTPWLSDTYRDRRFNGVLQHCKGFEKLRKMWIVCLDCGRTVYSVNRDGECAGCVAETDRLRELRV